MQPNAVPVHTTNMKRSLKSALKISVLSALAIAPVLLSGNGASAEPSKGMSDSYVGAGVGTSFTRGNGTGQEPGFGGNITGRVAVPNSPVSARGQVVYNDRSSAIIPQVTLDVPVARNTNLFVGGGASFVQGQPNSSTAVGDQNAAVVTAGVETKVGDNIVIYGNTLLGINGFKGSSTPAASVHVGGGFNF